jgi:hypothetical protein
MRMTIGLGPRVATMTIAITTVVRPGGRKGSSNRVRTPVSLSASASASSRYCCWASAEL